MTVRNLDRGAVLATRLVRAETVLARMRGLLGRDRLDAGEALWIAPCSSIHTFWMRFAIDALFLDRDGRVVRRYDGLRPGRATRIVRGARGVLELESGTLAATGTLVGDRIELGT